MHPILVQLLGGDISRSLATAFFGGAVGLLTWSFARNIRSVDRRQDDCEERDRQQARSIHELTRRVDDLQQRLASAEKRIEQFDGLLYSPTIPPHS
jgi:hypothetical protein